MNSPQNTRPQARTIYVKPGSKKGPLVERVDGQLVVYVRERAIDGAANTAVIKLLAAHFGVPKTCVQVVRGASSRHKVVQVDAPRSAP